MVARKFITTFLLLLTALPTVLRAQNYNVNDTLTEYPMKGTFYHNRFEGRKTASGEVFNQNLFTAAHWKIKLGTYVLVTNRNTGLQVIVKINDRCPRRGVLDMTRRAANGIGIKGCQPVTVRILPEGYEELCEAQDYTFDSVASRLAPISRDTLTPTTGAAMPKQRYNLVIGTVRNHGEAFEMISKLPKKYQGMATIDSVAGNDFNVTLTTNLPEKKASTLCKTLKRIFSHVRMTPAE